MSNNSTTLRSGYPPVILRTGGDITIQNVLEKVILRGEELNIVEAPGGEVVRVRTPTVVKMSLDGRRVTLRASSIGGHDHDSRYYTRDEVDDLLSSISIEVIDSLSSMEVGKPLSANQGRVLKGYIDAINTLLTSDNVNLDHVQELVDAIETIQLSLSTILVNDLTTGGISKALTAQQGVVLKGLIDALTTVVATKAVVAGNEGNIQYKKGSVLAGEDNNNYDDAEKSTNLYASLGSEKVSTPTLGSGWTQDATNYKKSSNGTATLTITTNSLYGEYYLLYINVTGLTVGSATVVCAGRTMGTITANGLYKYKVRSIATSGIVITPTNTARFDITKSLLSLKKFTGGDTNGGGKGNFGDKLSVTKTGSNYYPGDDEIFELNNPQGSYSNQVFRFGSTIKAAIQVASQGYFDMKSTDSNGLILQYGSTIGTASPYAYISPSGMRMTQGFGQFYGKVSAGYAYSNLPSKLDVWGSKMEMVRRVYTQNYTLDDDCLFVYDTSTAVGCTGTPSTNCSSYGSNEGVCTSHAEVGCSFVIQYYCSSYSWGSMGELSTCASAGGCSVATASCSGGSSDSTTCTNQNQYGGSCAYNYYTQDCSSFGSSQCNDNTANGCTVNNSQCAWTVYNCSQHGDATACGEHSGDGCTTNYFACVDYNGNESGCNEQAANGCSYADGICSGGNFTSCTGGNGTCGGDASCTPTDESSCVNTYYFTSCSGSLAYYLCEGNYNTGDCNGGAQGACQGTASCNSVIEGRCNNTYNPGCNWTNTLNLYLPNSATFYSIFGSNDRAMTRVYEGAVYGGGSVVLTTLGNDTFENGGTTKTLTNGKKYKKWFFAIKGNCSDFGSAESCGAQSGCTPNYDGETFLNCTGEYLKYRRWFVSEMV